MIVRTKGLVETAFLRTKGFKFVRLELSSEETHRKLFVFVLDSGDMSEEEVSKLRSSFRNRESQVEPQVFSDFIRGTGDILFDEVRKVRGT